MKIVLIHGQNHKGSSYHIGKMLADKFNDATIVEFFLPRDLEHFCLGCYNCIENEEKCPFYEKKNLIMKELEEADLMIFTTPTYCMRASAPMKSFLDLTFTYWMPHKPRNWMFSKKAVVISTSAGSGESSATKDISNALFFWGVPYIKEFGVSVQAMDWNSVKYEKKIKIDENITKLAKKISKKKRVKVGIKTKIIFNIMRFMQKKDMGSSKEEKNYWQNNGWLGKKRPWNNR